MYSTKLGELQAQVDVKIDQMTVGTQKLNETNAIVDGLRGELKQLEPILVEKKAAAEKMLQQVAVDQAEADKPANSVCTKEFLFSTTKLVAVTSGLFTGIRKRLARKSQRFPSSLKKSRPLRQKHRLTLTLPFLRSMLL